MNRCFIKGKIITKIQYEFMLEKNKNAIIIFYIELENRSRIRIIGYNNIADWCFQHLKEKDIVYIEGRLDTKEELQIIIKNIKIQNKGQATTFSKKIT